MRGTVGGSKIYVDTADGDYKNIDALVFDVVSRTDQAWYQDDTDLVVICGRKMLSDKYFPIINDAGDSQNKLAGQVLVSQKQIGGLKAVRVPFFPERQAAHHQAQQPLHLAGGARRRYIEDEPKRNRVVNYKAPMTPMWSGLRLRGPGQNIVMGPNPAPGA